jgi:hypothetical protein
MLAKTSKRKKPNGQRASNEKIPYDEAVAKGRDATTLFAGQERHYWTYVSELADRIEPEYGKGTVAKFASELGIGPCVLKRHLSVYRAWNGKGIEAPGPTSYAVMRALQNHPQRLEIVQKDPTITKREAEELMGRKRGKWKDKSRNNWQRAETERWLRRVHNLANDVKRAAAEVPRNEDVARILREIVEPELVPILRDGSTALLSLADLLEHLDAKPESKKAERKDAELEGVAL